MNPVTDGAARGRGWGLADLLRRRPDVRRTERQLAAQRGTNRTITVTEEDLTFAISPDWELAANVMANNRRYVFRRILFSKCGNV